MYIRAEKPDDVSAIYQVNSEAFGRENEASLVNQLRGAASTFSFVAIQSDQIVGHIFFSPVTVRGGSSNLSILGLAPIAVLPNYQRQGIGSLLIQQSLKACSESGQDAIVVLGDPKYYSRFGFISASTKGLRCEYDVPDEAFMVLELNSGALQDCTGTVQYRSEFKVCE
ncbi:N-acetyltransferase [Phormidium sp. CLA17]|uniref:GNAT family N-acetyltransferase n=1 Tax=Leptolyngbya sp. Cla-17 TaxID=2803751 RepID=UPI001491E953|nr:N-acetyltransferase [Leptolyngbya sp. Cla-17]MBM0741819.1 N-acetyltransferase [Leptolyngbya sp. Cla-17]